MNDYDTQELTLGDVPFVSAASPRGVSRLMERTATVPFIKGAVVFNEGDPPEHLFVVKRGSVEIVNQLEDGTEEVLRTVGPRELIGELGILGGHARSASARAAEDSELWAIEREAFLELYENEAPVSLSIASSMAKYLLDADAVAEDLLFLDLRGRVAKRLLSMMDVPEASVHRATATAELTKEQVQDRLLQAMQTGKVPQSTYSHLDRLALLSGGTRRNVSGVLNQLQGEGVLIVTEGTILVLNEGALEAAAAPG